jgi:hypothetical protein
MLLSVKSGLQAPVQASMTPAAWNSIHLWKRRQQPPLALPVVVLRQQAGLESQTQVDASPNKDLSSAQAERGQWGWGDTSRSRSPRFLVTPGRTPNCWKHPRVCTHHTAISLVLCGSVV